MVAPLRAGRIMADLAALQQKIIAFRNERDWAQFHDPKNLAEALSIEAGELLENFLWKTTEQSRNLSPEELKNVKEYLADIFIISFTGIKFHH
jgi:NTP pyrophosphatase (non-canonical NTP hydrolase)